MNDDNESNFNNIFGKYGGSIIGGIIAFVLCFTEFYKFLIYVVIILAGIFVGNYIQKNKFIVKEKLKELIDKF